MSKGWAILSTRYGGDIRQPSHEQLVQAIDEVVAEDPNGMAERDYAEHPNAWLRYGFDDGPVYVIDAYRGGTVICSQFAEQDDNDPVRENTLRDVSRRFEGATAVVVEASFSGEIASIQAEYPDFGW